MITTITVAEIAPLYEGTITNETFVQAQIDATLEILAAKIPCFDEKVTSGEIPRDLLILVVARAVFRLLRNPSGVDTQTAGPFSMGVKNLVASGDLWIPDNDLALLCPEMFGMVGIGTAMIQMSRRWAGC